MKTSANRAPRSTSRRSASSNERLPPGVAPSLDRAHAAFGSREHRGIEVDRRHRVAGHGERDGQAAGPRHELEHRTVLRVRQRQVALDVRRPALEVEVVVAGEGLGDGIVDDGFGAALLDLDHLVPAHALLAHPGEVFGPRPVAAQARPGRSSCP